MLTRSDFKKAPPKPGIYFFLDKAGKILYIGKAVNLKLRLLSYTDIKTLGPAKEKMVKESAKVKWLELESEAEALIEEAIAIKQRRPRYNIVFRDDKQYFFVGFSHSTSSWQSKERFPRIILTHQKKNGFEFCCLKNPPENDPREKIYKKNIRAIKNVLRGKSRDVSKSIEREMNTFSKKQNFEE